MNLQDFHYEPPVLLSLRKKERGCGDSCVVSLALVVAFLVGVFSGWFLW